ncbi:MAG: SufD family Fe-S cluster assembly protein, partial [Thermoplasmata archaeon]
ENSQDEWYYALKNLKNGIMVTNATLNGDNSKLLHRGALIGKDNEHYDIATNIYHLANNTKSEADIRAALNDSSRAVMRGKINVSKNSIDSNAYFSGNSLLLNKNAKSNALPFLEIEGNGSQARHSASITNLDYDQLFYVQTRGIDENESKNLIVEGFLDPVVRQILIYEGIRYLVYGE